MAAEVPSMPSAPNKLHANLSHITIQWQPPADNGGSPITGYIILWNVGDEAEIFNQTYT